MSTAETTAQAGGPAQECHLGDVFDTQESRVRSYCRSLDAVLTTALGSVVRDSRGREYIDFLAGAGSLNYGHNDPDLKRALLAYISRDGITHSLDLHTTAKRDFLESFEALVLAPCGLEHRVQFTGPTGTNAVEAALKLARKVTGRRNVIAFTHGFHGVSLGALAATANGHHRMAATTSLPDVTRMPYDGCFGEGVDTAELLAQLLDDPCSGIDPPAAILLETVQGEGGLDVASPRWLRRVAAIARRHGSLLIVDDIQAGCGRTGTFFSFEPAQIVPDLVTLSKSLSGMGLPLSVVLIRPDLDVWEPGEHNGTFRGNNHAFVTARAALEKSWADDVLSTAVAARARTVSRELARMAEFVPGARLKGRGMMQGLDVVSGTVATEVRRRCVADGLIIESSGSDDQVLKVLAPLTTPDEVLAQGLAILFDAVVTSSYLAGDFPRASTERSAAHG
ncbi:diaminobutyrate--2-oxoglutarate transaminase [Terrabacter aerolatus]|uniref:Diaminobutyrate--2-oxoglutarate transaminase n=1 Tax=Terrabacter aerolatus TaxID=422442 RepID=A0A512D2K0_9MICO|nr:diaminobutyrate--2-oxoglutarate transaminase [Terrabacter aerolatus]GEO30697.1 diaminobutyrate--2-oxoglutarate transaminase [Terrabacter aerolatus]